ncbi:unnamed protein product [Polarella glacialis]|uniref:Chloride channel protein n=1 Tax=Polarella glacialis TaxID=89957 RepID=A0A813I1U2_POLGL|nr:unnamed protein product [Polarella glacialis]
MGASLGGLFGRVLRDFLWPLALVFPFGDGTDAFAVPSTYAIVGMAASLGAVCGVPLTAVVLLLELAGGKDYGVVLPTVAAVGVAVYVEDSLTSWAAGSNAASPIQAANKAGTSTIFSQVERLMEASALRPLRDVLSIDGEGAPPPESDVAELCAELPGPKPRRRPMGGTVRSAVAPSSGPEGLALPAGAVVAGIVESSLSLQAAAWELLRSSSGPPGASFAVLLVMEEEEEETRPDGNDLESSPPKASRRFLGAVSLADLQRAAGELETATDV